MNGHYTRYGFYEQYKANQEYADYGLAPWPIGDTTLSETDLVRWCWLDNHFYGGTFALRWQPSVNFPGMSGTPVLQFGGAWSRYEGKHFGEIIWTGYFSGAPKDFRYYDNDADKQDANLFLKTKSGSARGFSALLDVQVRQVRYTFLGFDNMLNNVSQEAKADIFQSKGRVVVCFFQGLERIWIWRRRAPRAAEQGRLYPIHSHKGRPEVRTAS